MSHHGQRKRVRRHPEQLFRHQVHLEKGTGRIRTYRRQIARRAFLRQCIDREKKCMISPPRDSGMGALKRDTYGGFSQTSIESQDKQAKARTSKPRPTVVVHTTGPFQPSGKGPAGRKSVLVRATGQRSFDAMSSRRSLVAPVGLYRLAGNRECAHGFNEKEKQMACLSVRGLGRQKDAAEQREAVLISKQRGQTQGRKASKAGDIRGHSPDHRSMQRFHNEEQKSVSSSPSACAHRLRVPPRQS